MPKSKTNSPHKKANKLRKERYRQDPEYRVKTCANSRRLYRENHGGLAKPRDCSANIALVQGHKIGRTRNVFCADGKRREIFCLSLKELCEALGGYFLDNVREWIYKGMFPGPIHHAPVDVTGRSRMGIYTQDEVLVLLDVFKEHQATKAYFTKKDKGVTGALFGRIATARKSQRYGTKAAKAANA